MKVVWNSIPETANLEEYERKIELENRLIDSGELQMDEIPKRDAAAMMKQLGMINMETVLYRSALSRKLKDKPMSKEEAEKLVA